MSLFSRKKPPEDKAKSTPSVPDSADTAVPAPMQGLLASIAAPFLDGPVEKNHVFPRGGVTGAEIAQLMLDAGYRAELETDRDGDPRIQSGASGLRFAICFYGKGPRYSSIQFGCGYDVKGDFSPDRAAEWNRCYRFGRLFLDKDGDPVVQMDLEVEEGFTAKAFVNNLERWSRVIADCSSFVFKRE